MKVSRIVIGTHNYKREERSRDIQRRNTCNAAGFKRILRILLMLLKMVLHSENAIKKALELARFCKMYVMADDSGLEVDALDKRPGVFSSRYCGERCRLRGKMFKITCGIRRSPF